MLSIHSQAHLRFLTIYQVKYHFVEQVISYKISDYISQDITLLPKLIFGIFLEPLANSVILMSNTRGCNTSTPMLINSLHPNDTYPEVLLYQTTPSLGWHIGCLLWFQILVYVLPESLNYCIKYHNIMDHVRARLFSKSSLTRLQEFLNSSICLNEIKKKNLSKSTW